MVCEQIIRLVAARTVQRTVSGAAQNVAEIQGEKGGVGKFVYSAGAAAHIPNRLYRCAMCSDSYVQYLTGCTGVQCAVTATYST
jgi:hypothetical protein